MLKKMKFVAILLILVGTCYGWGPQCAGDYFTSVLEKCLVNYGGDKELMEDFYYLRKPTTENGMCYSACVMQECNYMDASGALNPNTYKGELKILSHGDDVKGKLIASDFEKCLQITKIDENKCITAANYLDCLSTNCKDCDWDLHGI